MHWTRNRNQHRTKLKQSLKWVELYLSKIILNVTHSGGSDALKGEWKGRRNKRIQSPNVKWKLTANTSAVCSRLGSWR